MFQGAHHKVYLNSDDALGVEDVHRVKPQRADRPEGVAKGEKEAVGIVVDAVRFLLLLELPTSHGYVRGNYLGCGGSHDSVVALVESRTVSARDGLQVGMAVR